MRTSDRTSSDGTTSDGLFEPPADRLGRRLHGAVFDPLPSALGRACDTPEVAAAVRPLLARGWRPAQLSARLGALPDPPGDPVPAVVAFLGQLLERTSPQEAFDRERAERERERAEQAERAPVPASDAERERWVAQARRSLGMTGRPRPVPALPRARACASCPGEGSFFVTKEVRLCGACVQLLQSGRARLAVSA